jgi:hypothetical protein
MSRLLQPDRSGKPGSDKDNNNSGSKKRDNISSVGILKIKEVDIMAGKWIQGAVKKMEEKGTVGSFGKATEAKIRAAKKAGGKEEKKAVFAENMKKIARKKARRGGSRR